MLKIIDRIPSGLLNASPRDMADLLDRPTLLHLSGRRKDRLFISVLLHGNEDVGLLAVQQVLRHYEFATLPRSVSIFIGNVAAAKLGVRRLDNQPDYNRVWPGSSLPPTAEHQLMQHVVDSVTAMPLFASIDIHNNMGLNPQYACVTDLAPASLQLARLFSRTIVYFTQPTGVQASAFAKFCPSTTVECGQPGNRDGARHAAEFLDACLHLQQLPEHAPREQDIDLFHTLTVVKLHPECSYSTDDPSADLVLSQSVDQLNFRELQPGTSLGETSSTAELPLRVFDNDGRDVTSSYLRRQGREIVVTKAVMPSMLTTREDAIRKDCLCYFMERYPLPK